MKSVAQGCVTSQTKRRCRTPEYFISSPKSSTYTVLRSSHIQAERVGPSGSISDLSCIRAVLKGELPEAGGSELSGSDPPKGPYLGLHLNLNRVIGYGLIV